MSFAYGSLSSTARASLRAGCILLIPAAIIVSLLYVAATQEEEMHNRNLRWLAQIATQVQKRVETYSNLVRDRAEAKSKPAANSGTASSPSARKSVGYSIDGLKPVTVPDQCDAKSQGHIRMMDDGQEPQLYFIYSNGVDAECAQSGLRQIVEPALRKDAFTSVLLAERSGKVWYQYGPESLRITNVA